MPESDTGYLPPADVGARPQWPMVAIFGAALALGLICLLHIDNPTAATGLIAIVLTATWLAAATAITHACGAYRLALKPPQMQADFHQLRGFRVEVRLGNRARRLPALFATIRLDTSAEGVSLVSPPLFVGQLPARATVACAWEITVRKRGEVELRGVRVRACFPGSLIAHEGRFPFAHRLLALPAVYRLDNRALDLLSGHRRVGSRSAAAPASVGDFVGVRDYRPGDNPRDIHLRLSMRRPDFPLDLAMREFEDPSTDDIAVVLDTWLPEHAPDAGVLRYNHEVSLSFAVAFCRMLVDRRYRVRFCAVSGGGEKIDISITRPAQDLPLLEARLARLQPVVHEAPVARLLSDARLRATDAVFFIALREAVRLPGRGAVLSVAPHVQSRLVREVVGA